MVVVGVGGVVVVTPGAVGGGAPVPAPSAPAESSEVPDGAPDGTDDFGTGIDVVVVDGTTAAVRDGPPRP